MPAFASSRIKAVASVTAFALLLSAYVLASECLQLTVRNPHFLSNLGTSIVGVAAHYVGFGLFSGAIVGLVFNTALRQTLALALVFYVVLSLKLFWFDTRLLANPVTAAIFIALSLLLFGTVAFCIRRFALSATTPLLVVTIYLNVCALVAAVWSTHGGSFVALLVTPRTVVVCSVGGAILVAAVLAQTRLEARGRPWLLHACAVALLIVGALIANGQKAGREPVAPAHTNEPAPGGPDIYVLSFDALRRDRLDAFVRSHPASHLAQVVARGQVFANVVANGLSTSPVLARNTFSGPTRTCSTSLPGTLKARGHATIMMIGRSGKSFMGADCYEDFWSGSGGDLARQFKLVRLTADIWASGSSRLRHKMIPSSELLDGLVQRLDRLGRAPVFAYIHFLDLHEPYVPRARENEESYLSDIQRYNGRCFTQVCDPRDAESARLIAVARGAYEEIVLEVDELVGRALQIARSRGRDFTIVITSDHGELFGEHGGFSHGGGFVPELLNIPYVVFDGRGEVGARRCELLLGSEALRATATGQPYPDHAELDVAATLGSAHIDRASGSLRFEISAASQRHAGTWRNVHREISGTLAYPFETCQR